jgi:RNA polymerase sigma-70 factor (ECF subfamily)
MASSASKGASAAGLALQKEERAAIVGEESSADAAAEFEALLRGVVDGAFGTALRLAGTQEDAEDLVQEAALNAFRGFHTFQRGTNFRAWFFRILINAFYASGRKRRPESSFEDLQGADELYLYTRTVEAGLHAHGTDPVQATLGRMTAEQIVEALEALPEDYRVASTLYFMEDLSYQEIAEVLDVPIGTVRSRLHRGRKMLQKQLWHLAEEAGLVGHSPSWRHTRHDVASLHLRGSVPPPRRLRRP